MGNSPLTSLRNEDQPYFKQIGASASICIQGREVKEGDNEEISEKWEMAYVVGKSHCHLVLTKSYAGNTTLKSDPYCDDKLAINIFDLEGSSGSRQSFTFTARGIRIRAAAGVLKAAEQMDHMKVFASFDVSTTNALGGITRKVGHVYGSGTTKGLIIRECNFTSKRDHERLYMLTLRHYYANSENGNDVGLSLVVKRIRVSSNNNGDLDFVVDGPHQHPVYALWYMFDQIGRTRTWDPTYCPHCVNCLIQNHGISWQSETEDSDIDNVPAAPLLHKLRDDTSSSSAGGILANRGRFMGRNNGNLNIKNFFARGR